MPLLWRHSPPRCMTRSTVRPPRPRRCLPPPGRRSEARRSCPRSRPSPRRDGLVKCAATTWCRLSLKSTASSPTSSYAPTNSPRRTRIPRRWDSRGTTSFSFRRLQREPDGPVDRRHRPRAGREKLLRRLVDAAAARRRWRVAGVEGRRPSARRSSVSPTSSRISSA